jgi:hypothetical protein
VGDFLTSPEERNSELLKRGVFHLFRNPDVEQVQEPSDFEVL